MGFLREVDVDVMKSAEFVYSGENGNASLKVRNSAKDINQRTADFLGTVEYEVSPNTHLSNGDTVYIVASYDKNIARQYNFHAVNTRTRIKVSGLDDQYEALKDIDKAYLKDIYRAANDYIQTNKETIFQVEMNEEVRQIHFNSQQTVYRAFLKSKQAGKSDRILQISQLTYTYQKKEYVLYYAVIVTEINTGKEVQTQDIYGEKANLTQDEINHQTFDEYVLRVYSAVYDIETIK